jgi:hypothetical protein
MSDAATIPFLLAEEKAYWFKNSSVLGLLPDGGLIREWRNVPKVHRDAVIANLKARRKETDPKVEGIAHPGLFRIVSVDDVLTDSGFTIRETLALGMATTIDTALNVSRIGEDNANPGAASTWPASPAHTGTSAIQQPIRACTLKWVNIDPNALEAIRTARSSVTETTLTVNAETLTGPWYKTKIVTTQDVDGSGIYSEVWALGETAFESVAATGDRALSANRVIINVPKDRVATVLNAEIAALGAKYKAAGYTYTQRVNWSGDTAEITTEASEDYEKSDSNTSATSKASTTVRTIYKDTSSIPDAAAAAQGITRKVVGDITNTGDFEYVAETDTAVKQEIAVHTAEISAAKTITEQVGKNLYDADLTGYEPITVAAGHIKRLEKRVNPDGTFDDVVRDETSTSQTATDDATSKSDRHYDDDAKTIDAVVHTAAIAAVADVAFTTQGTVTDVKNAPNEDGTFRTDVETTVSKEQEQLDIVVGEEKFKQVKADIGKQIKDTNLAAHYALTQTTGEVQTRILSENDDGTVNVTRNRDIARNVTAAESADERQAFETVTRVVDRNNTAGDTPVAQVAGTIVEIDNKTNDYDRVDVTVKTRTAVPQTTTFASQSAKLTTESTVTARNAAAQADASGGGSGTVVQVRSALNEFLKYDNETVTKTAVADSQTQTVDSNAFAATVATKKRNAAALEAGTGGGSGTIVKASGQINEFGLFDTDKEVTTPVANVTAGGDKVAAADSVLIGSTVRNVASPATAPTFTAGQIDVQRKRLTESGLWDVESSTDTRQDLSIAAPAALDETGNMVASPRHSSLIQVIDGQITAPAALGSAYGRVDYKKDKYGRYVGVREITTYNDTITLPGWALTSTDRDVTHISYMTVDRIGYKRTFVYTISELQTSSAATAVAFCGGSGVLVGCEAGKSDYVALSNGQYRSTKIVLKSDSGWTADTNGNLP